MIMEKVVEQNEKVLKNGQWLTWDEHVDSIRSLSYWLTWDEHVDSIRSLGQAL